MSSKWMMDLSKDLTALQGLAVGLPAVLPNGHAIAVDFTEMAKRGDFDCLDDAEYDLLLARTEDMCDCMEAAKKPLLEELARLNTVLEAYISEVRSMIVMDRKAVITGWIDEIRATAPTAEEVGLDGDELDPAFNTFPDEI